MAANGRRLNDQQAREDHDSLTRIEVKVDALTALVAVKADSNIVNDHEERLRNVETFFKMWMGALTLAQILVGLYVAFVK